MNLIDGLTLKNMQHLLVAKKHKYKLSTFPLSNHNFLFTYQCLFWVLDDNQNENVVYCIYINLNN